MPADQSIGDVSPYCSRTGMSKRGDFGSQIAAAMSASSSKRSSSELNVAATEYVPSKRQTGVFSGSDVRSLKAHTRKVHSVGWNCDGTQLASGSTDKSARIWNVNSDGKVNCFGLHCLRSQSTDSDPSLEGGKNDGMQRPLR
jgi:WD40 repeat protein